MSDRITLEEYDVRKATDLLKMYRELRKHKSRNAARFYVRQEMQYTLVKSRSGVRPWKHNIQESEVGRVTGSPFKHDD